MSSETKPARPAGTSERPPDPTSADDGLAAQRQVLLQAERFAAMLGTAITLMLRSPGHRNLFVAELEWRIYPPIMLGQFRLFLSKGLPFAFITWAMVNDEVESRMKTSARLQTPEWNCGQNFVVVDVIAPFGGAERCLAALAASRSDPSNIQTTDSNLAAERRVAERA
ncbi:MAG: toxin-activating lysine-acyltransferase [Xanthobacteraceae bacterium]|nr:toxin-activating lysine-acyltransferase [Xanthobacteraceae bacterium]